MTNYYISFIPLHDGAASGSFPQYWSLRTIPSTICGGKSIHYMEVTNESGGS